jgi:hypothetical protein
MNKEIPAAELVARLTELDAKATPGPWFAAGDDAEDCPDHAGSGLALVDTGRMSDWPAARLCEWYNARLIAFLGTHRGEILAHLSRLEAAEKELALHKRLDEARAQQPDWEKLWAEQSERAEAAEKALAEADALAVYDTSGPVRQRYVLAPFARDNESQYQTADRLREACIKRHIERTPLPKGRTET